MTLPLIKVMTCFIPSLNIEVQVVLSPDHGGRKGEMPGGNWIGKAFASLCLLFHKQNQKKGIA